MRWIEQDSDIIHIMSKTGPHRIGGVAQLGERLLCKQEVIGSIPFTSTNFVGDFLFGVSLTPTVGA